MCVTRSMWGQLPKKHFVWKAEQMRKENQAKGKSCVRKWGRNGLKCRDQMRKARKRKYIGVRRKRTRESALGNGYWSKIGERRSFFLK